MNVSVELLLGIGLAVTIPLLGVVATCLFMMKSDMKQMNETLKSFNTFFEDIRSSLNHNRNEHTQMMAISNAILKELADSKQDVMDRIELSEERQKHRGSKS